MARAAISSANAASLSASPWASRVAVREHSRWIAVRMMTSGSGTFSAATIMLETKLMLLLLSSCVRWQWKEGAGARLVRAIALAARAQHLRFQRRDAGDVHQDPVHEDRRQQCRPTPRILKG